MSRFRAAASRVLLTGMACAGLLFGTNPAVAGALSVTPVRVEIAPGRQFCSISISNDQDRAVSVQIRGYGWRQDDLGDEVLDAGAGIVVNPEIVTLGPQQTRLVRCSVPASHHSSREESWRLIVDELPPQTSNPSAAVKAMLRLSIPVFRTPDAASVRLSGQPNGGALMVRNTGTRHVKILGLIVTSGGDTRRLGQSFYLLASAQRQIALPEGLSPGSARFAVETVDGVIPIAFGDEPAS